MILEYSKVRHNSRTPERANPSDAGLDVFYSPEESDLTGQWLKPAESKVFSTGLKFGVPHGYMLEVKNRSGNAAKKSLLVGACVIDSGYEGEVFVNLHNVGVVPQFIHADMKIAQIVMTPVVHFRPLEVEESRIYSYPITISDRGQGTLGSTDG
jgi:dUTP pyrophosphatase